jgi:hypothetical protein
LSEQYPNQNGPFIPSGQQQPGPYPSQQVVNPGQTLGIVGLVLAFIATPVGLVLSIIGLQKSKKAGMKNGTALAGIVISAVFMVVGVLVGILMVVGASLMVQQCAQLGPGVHQVNGSTITCGER